jgi:hypothetical protein
MRILFALPLLIAGGCNVDNDTANDKLTVKYDQKKIERAASTTAHAARQVGTAAGHVAAATGRAVKKEVGDVDVDVKVRRKRSDEAGKEVQKR